MIEIAFLKRNVTEPVKMLSIIIYLKRLLNEIELFSSGSIYTLKGTEVLVVEMSTNRSVCVRYIFNNTLSDTKNPRLGRVRALLLT